ncbi:MFS transporter, partial [Streptomyces sp. NPDC020802]|uniref:MFS transporter n=1 Tax=Streptomyces sp. NPDC020802 TaxID=3365094 RepID=UPI0037BB629C
MSTLTGRGTSAGPSVAATGSARQVPILWLALLATPVAAANNASVLILDPMSRALGVTTATASWLVTVFALSLAVATPLMATLLRRRGTRPVLWLSAAFVVVGTVLVAASPWLPLTLAGRAVQAAGGAGMMTLAVNLAGTTRRMGVISAGSGILGAVGPLLGQRLTDAFSWQAALSLLVATLLAVPAVSRHTTIVPRTEGRFDSRGALLLAMLSSGLVLLPSNPLLALAVALVAAVLLAWHIRRRPDGYVPVAALRSSRFRSSVVIALGLSMTYFTLLFAIPQLLGERVGWSTDTVATGQMVAMIVGSVVTLVFAAVAARLNRITVRAVLLVAGALAALVAVFAHSAVLLLVAIGLAVFSATSANSTQAMEAGAAVPARQRPTALGLFTLAYLMGGA